MGSRSRIHSRRKIGRVRRNHDPKLKEARLKSKFERKYGKPIRVLKAKRLILKRALEDAGMTMEQAENSPELSHELEVAMNECASYESQYFDWRASTELSKGHYDQHLPSMKLLTAINKSAVKAVESHGYDPEKHPELCERVASEWRHSMCRRANLPKEYAARRLQRGGVNVEYLRRS